MSRSALDAARRVGHALAKRLGGLPSLALLVAVAAVVALPGRAYADDQPPLSVTLVRENTSNGLHEEYQTEAKSSFAEAWDYALAQATSTQKESENFVTPIIVLGRDCVIDSEFVIPKSEYKKIQVDLNGYCLRRDTDGEKVSNGGLFRVLDGGILLIKDSRPSGPGYRGIKGGVITGGASTNGGGAVTLEKGGNLVIEGGTIYKCITDDHGGAIKMEGWGKYLCSLKMTGGRFYFCQTVGAWSNCHGGAIFAEDAIIDISGAKFDSCYSEDNGGGIYLSIGKVRLSDTIFSGNHCADYGGAVYVDNSEELYIDKCRFSTNEAKDNGGALYVDGGPFCMIRGCVFNKNRSHGEGGAVYVNNKNCYIVDTDVIANSAKGDGGGVYVDSRYDVALKGRVRIYGNDGRFTRDNLTLQDGNASRAYAFLGGLYEGSHVGLSSTSRNVRYAYGASSEDLGYLFSDAGGILRLQGEYTLPSPFYSSVFGGGQGTYLVLGAGLALASGVATYTLATKRTRDREARS